MRRRNCNYLPHSFPRMHTQVGLELTINGDPIHQTSLVHGDVASSNEHLHASRKMYSNSGVPPRFSTWTIDVPDKIILPYPMFLCLLKQSWECMRMTVLYRPIRTPLNASICLATSRKVRPVRPDEDICLAKKK